MSKENYPSPCIVCFWNECCKTKGRSSGPTPHIIVDIQSVTEASLMMEVHPGLGNILGSWNFFFFFHPNEITLCLLVWFLFSGPWNFHSLLPAILMAEALVSFRSCSEISSLEGLLPLSPGVALHHLSLLLHCIYHRLILCSIFFFLYSLLPAPIM